jgi:hypothetical protein
LVVALGQPCLDLLGAAHRAGAKHDVAVVWMSICGDAEAMGVEGSLAGAGPSESRAMLMEGSGDVQRADVFVRDCRWIAVSCAFLV